MNEMDIDDITTLVTLNQPNNSKSLIKQTSHGMYQTLHTTMKVTEAKKHTFLTAYKQ